MPVCFYGIRFIGTNKRLYNPKIKHYRPKPTKNRLSDTLFKELYQTGGYLFTHTNHYS